MVAQISMSIVMFFVIIIIISVITLLGITPSAIKEYKTQIANQKIINFSPKESLSVFMEELSSCSNSDRVQELLKKISETATNTYTADPDSPSAKNARAVLIWLDSFSVGRHIDDLKKLKYSSQIRYDKKKQDFKLVLPTD